MLEVYCDWCGEELQEPGAVLISPPDSDGRALKQHVCVVCYDSGVVARRLATLDT